MEAAHLHRRQFPGWDAAEDPLEVGSATVNGDTLSLQPDTGLAYGSSPGRYRFELFRGRLRLRFDDRGVDDFNLTTVPLARQR